MGRLRLRRAATETPYIAVSLNGRIETVVPAPLIEPGVHQVAALLPEDRFKGARDALEIYLVQGEPEAPRLERLITR